ncbi:hypothetical protein D3C86_1541430 [compost metagenome]
MNRLRKTKVIAQASTSIFPLESSEHVPRIHGCHHPKSPLAFDFQDVRSTNQMTIAESTVLIFTLVAKHHTDACARPDRYSAKVRSDRYVEALLLGFYDSQEVEIGMALSVKIDINGVEHNCAPVAICMELPGIAHATRRAGIVGNYW